MSDPNSLEIPNEWTTSRRTGNADLLAGHVGAWIMKLGGDTNYELVALGNPLTVRNTMTGNSFNVIVEQVGGVE